jgi:hypothetical protein
MLRGAAEEVAPPVLQPHPAPEAVVLPRPETAAGAVSNWGLPTQAAPRSVGPRPVLRAVAAALAGSGPLREAGHFAERLVYRAAAAVGLAVSEPPREAGRFAGRPVLRAAEIAGWAAFGRSRAASHEAADRVGSAPARAEAREVLDRAAFAPRRGAGRQAVVAVVERAAPWPAPVGREVCWRLVGVAGWVRLGLAHLELGAGRVAACLYLYRPPAAQGLARGEFRPLRAQKATTRGRPWRPELQC